MNHGAQTTVYALAMAGVSYCAHHIGTVGGLITIAVMLLAARWYDN
jgi:hypothetical protein